MDKKHESLKHSIVIITYQQDQTIKRAIESVINQSILPYEILICDDCSLDNTAEIVKEYMVKFPNLINYHRNDVNLGIFGNISHGISKASGDIVSLLAGDDTLEFDLVETCEKMIQEHGVDFLKDKYVIVFDIRIIYSNGKRKLLKNNKLSKRSMFSERLRYGFFNREIAISKNVLNQNIEFTPNFGVHGDWIFGLDLDINTDYFIFTNKVSSNYYAGLGVVKQSKKVTMYADKIRANSHIVNKYGTSLTKNDVKFLKFESYMYTYFINHDLKSYIISVYYYFVNIFNFSLLNGPYKKIYLSVFIPPFIRKLIARNREK